MKTINEILIELKTEILKNISFIVDKRNYVIDSIEDILENIGSLSQEQIDQLYNIAKIISSATSTGKLIILTEQIISLLALLTKDKDHG